MTTDADAVFVLALPGRDVRHLDPMRVEMELGKALADWRERVDELAKTNAPLPPGTSVETVRRREARQHECIRDLSRAAAGAFDMPPLSPDGSGYTDKSRILALAEYLKFCTSCLESSRPLASGGGPTGSPASAP